MIHHLVFWKLKDQAEGLDKTALAAELRSRLEALPALIPQIRSFRVGDNFSERPVAMDLALVSEFESVEDLKTYSEHPDHQAVALWLKNVVAETRVVDFEA